MGTEGVSASDQEVRWHRQEVTGFVLAEAESFVCGRVPVREGRKKNISNIFVQDFFFIIPAVS